MSNYSKILVLAASFAASVEAQSSSAPNLFNVLSWSSVFNQPVYNNGGTKIGTLPNAVPNVFAYQGPTTGKGKSFDIELFQPDTSIVNLNNAINTNIAVALGVIPLASPASGVIFQTDPVTGVDLPATNTLGPIFTERGETIGKHRLYIGVSHQDFHFTSLNGHSLNSLSVLYEGGAPSGIVAAGSTLTSYPATFNIGMDVRLSQDVAFITYGITDRIDVSVGLPVVHAAVAARTYDGILYDGDGLAGQQKTGNQNCWCAGTFNPGAIILNGPTSSNFQEPDIGQSSLGRTGFGDLLVRVKGTVIHTTRAAVAIGGDIRFATGDAQNYLGTGTTSVKPFVAVSLYAPTTHGIVFSPHLNLGWQYSGQSVLGGQLQATPKTATLDDDVTTVPYLGAPLTATQGYLPDVFSWAVGSEIAFGRHNTLVLDVLGNEIGLVHGIPNLVTATSPIPGFQPVSPYASVPVSGLIQAGTTSYSQFNGAFGYKARLIGNLVFTFNALVRFDNNGLTARFTPLYGLGYTF